MHILLTQDGDEDESDAEGVDLWLVTHNNYGGGCGRALVPK